MSIPPRTFWPLFDLSTIKIGDGEKSTEPPMWKQSTEPPLWKHSEVPLLDDNGEQRYDDDDNPTTIIAWDPKSLHSTDVDNPRQKKRLDG